MIQGQDLAQKYISKDYLKKLITILLKDINIQIDETTEIEVLTEEQISIEHSLCRPDLTVRIGNIIFMLKFQNTIVGILDKKYSMLTFQTLILKKIKKTGK